MGTQHKIYEVSSGWGYEEPGKLLNHGTAHFSLSSIENPVGLHLVIIEHEEWEIVHCRHEFITRNSLSHSEYHLLSLK